MKVRSFRDLIAWQKAMDLVTLVYQVTEPFPRAEMFGLTNQLRRAAVSVPSNIAEGQARNSTKEFVNFLSISMGSLAEIETQLLIAQRLNYVKESVVNKPLQLTSEVGRIVNGLMNSLTPGH